MAYKLLGKNFIPPDVHAKVTGKAIVDLVAIQRIYDRLENPD